MRKVAGCTNGGSRAENCNFYCACKWALHLKGDIDIQEITRDWCHNLIYIIIAGRVVIINRNNGNRQMIKSSYKMNWKWTG